MEKPIYKTGNVSVYKDKIVLNLIVSKTVIPISQISSVDGGNPMLGKVFVETTGGKRYGLPIFITARGKFLEAVDKARSSLTSDSSKRNLDELERLADLRDKKIITEEDFNNKKKQILGL